MDFESTIISFMIVTVFAIIGYMSGEFFKRFPDAAPDDFANDAKAWVDNQVAHMGLGAGFIAVYMSIGWFIMGELPDRETAACSLYVGYALFEARQRGTKLDQLQDWLFVAYGGSMVAFMGHWTFGMGWEAKLFPSLHFFAVFVLHLLGGYLWRKRQM